jgi:hypothetical protein
MTKFSYIVIGFKPNMILHDSKISTFHETLDRARESLSTHKMLYPKSDVYITKIIEEEESN